MARTFTFEEVAPKTFTFEEATAPKTFSFEDAQAGEVDGRVTQMASATRATVGVVGRAVAALDVAQAGANAETLPPPVTGVETDEFGRPTDPRGRNPAQLNPAWEGTRLSEITGSEMLMRPLVEIPGIDLGILGPSQANVPTSVKVAAGAYNAAKGLPEFATSLLGVSTLAAGGFPAVVQRLIAGGYAIDMARHTPEQVVALAKAVESGDAQDISETATSLGLNVALVGLTARHALTSQAPGAIAARAINKAVGETGFVDPNLSALTRVAPLTADAVAATGHAPRETVPATITPLTSAAVESVKEPVLETPAPTPAAATSELGNVPARTGTEPPAKPSVTPDVTNAKVESEQALTTGIKNAAVDSEREARGQSPIMTETRISNQETWDSAMARIEREPVWQDRLVDELKEQPRTPSAEEVVGLDHRYVELQNEYTKATKAGEKAFESGDSVALEEAKNQSAFYEGKLAELEGVARKIGAEWGRSGQMRQRLLKEDYTLAAMESRARAAKGFEPLTEAEHAEIGTLHEKLAAAETKAAEVETAANERIAMLEAQKALAEAQAAAQPAYAPGVLVAAEKFASFMDKRGADALGRIKERLGRTSAGIDPTILSDVGILGAAKITRGVVDFAKWTDAMVRDLGEWFREYAKDAWDASQTAFEKEAAQLGRTTRARIKGAADLPGRIANVTEAIKTKAASGEGSPLHSEVRKLVRLLVEQDPKITREGLIDSVHGILKESMPEITRIEAMDAISGRGRFWTPDQSAIAKQVRDLSTQIRLVAHQMDVEAGKPMPRTGYQPDKLSEAASLEKRKLNDLMRKYGVVVTDPARQLGAILSALKTRLEREKSDLTRRLEEGDFSPRRKNRELPLDKETALARAEVEMLRDRFKRQLAKHEYEKKSRAEKIWLGAKEALNLSRALLTSWDVSAVFRQGGFVGLGNPVRAAKALGPMFEALVSEKRAAAIEQQIKARPNAKLYEQSKLFLAPRDSVKLTGMEEAFMSRIASKIPGVGASQRAYITFLNKLRADTFDALHESLTSRRGATPEELSAISNYINVATGRGNLGKAAAAAETLATVFFSPRLVASRFQLLFGQPAYRGSAATRYLVAKEYAKFLTGIATVYGLAQLAGATVETNSRSSDFGKLKFGNTRVDPLGGLSQTSVLVSRLATGEKTNLKGVTEKIRGKVPYGKATAADVIAQFLRTKLSPVAGSAVDVATSKNVVGEEVTPRSVAVNAVVPLSFRDILDVMEEQGVPRGTAISILSLFGMGVQNYENLK